MKKIVIIFLLAINSIYSQNDYTILSESVYNTIKFHDVLFTDIKATNGNTAQMVSLFPINQDENNDTGIALNHPNDVSIEEFGQMIGEPQKYFEYDSGLKVFFANDDPDPQLEVIGVEAKIITIDGISLEIGDPISDLTSVNYTIATGENNYKFVNIIKSGHYAESLILSLDSFNHMTAIKYYVNP